MYQRLDWHMVLYIRFVHMKCGRCFTATHLLSRAFQSDICVFIPFHPITKPCAIFRRCSDSPTPAYHVCVLVTQLCLTLQPHGLWPISESPDKTGTHSSHVVRFYFSQHFDTWAVALSICIWEMYKSAEW